MENRGWRRAEDLDATIQRLLQDLDVAARTAEAAAEWLQSRRETVADAAARHRLEVAVQELDGAGKDVRAALLRIHPFAGPSGPFRVGTLPL